LLRAQASDRKSLNQTLFYFSFFTFPSPNNLAFLGVVAAAARLSLLVDRPPGGGQYRTVKLAHTPHRFYQFDNPHHAPYDQPDTRWPTIVGNFFAPHSPVQGGQGVCFFGSWRS
jgi:hypothetical protein